MISCIQFVCKDCGSISEIINNDTRSCDVEWILWKIGCPHCYSDKVAFYNFDIAYGIDKLTDAQYEYLKTRYRNINQDMPKIIASKLIALSKNTY